MSRPYLCHLQNNTSRTFLVNILFYRPECLFLHTHTLIPPALYFVSLSSMRLPSIQKKTATKPACKLSSHCYIIKRQILRLQTCIFSSNYKKVQYKLICCILRQIVLYCTFCYHSHVTINKCDRNLPDQSLVSCHKHTRMGSDTNTLC